MGARRHARLNTVYTYTQQYMTRLLLYVFDSTPEYEYSFDVFAHRGQSE